MAVGRDCDVAVCEAVLLAGFVVRADADAGTVEGRRACERPCKGAILCRALATGGGCGPRLIDNGVMVLVAEPLIAPFVPSCFVGDCIPVPARALGVGLWAMTLVLLGSGITLLLFAVVVAAYMLLGRAFAVVPLL